MKINVVDITPDMATRLLDLNTKNRPLDKSRAYRMGNAIKRGEWQLNGDTVRISTSGVLLDGQHRLYAIELSGITVKTILIEDLPDDVFKTIDTNSRSRMPGDILAMDNVKYYNSVAAAAHLYIRYTNSGHPYNNNGRVQPTVQQVLKVVEDNPKLVDAAESIGPDMWLKKFVTSSVAIFAYYVFQQDNEKMGSLFFSKLTTGIDLTAGCPILALRDRLITEKASSKTKISKAYKLALIFKAYKLFKKNISVKYLRVATEGTSADKDIFKL